MGQECNALERLGFTLIELLIVIAIAGLIAALAYPAYTDRLRQARRADAYDSLMYLQNLQEKYRANNASYGTLGQTAFPGAVSNAGFYNIAVISPSATGYVSTATAAAGTSQTADTGCTVLTLTVNAANPRGLRTPAACWQDYAGSDAP